MPRRPLKGRLRRDSHPPDRAALSDSEPGDAARSDAAGVDAGGAPAEGASTPSERPSRSARKRQAVALQQLGVRLMDLTPARLRQLALPEPLLEAVLEAQRLRSRAALARQRQYIGRLMRAVDPEPIEQALSACRPPPQRQC